MEPINQSQNSYFKEFFPNIEVPQFLGGALNALSSAFSSEKALPARYIFSQQFNDACHAIPWMNLKTLKVFKEKGYQVDQMAAYDRRTWFGKNYPHFRDWHMPIQQLNDPETAKKYPHLVAYFNNAIEQAPVLPHFYDEKGQWMMDGITGLVTGFMMPNTAIDVNSLRSKEIQIGCGQTFKMDELMPTQGLYYPLILDEDNQYKIFDQDLNEFVPVDYSAIKNDYSDNVVDFKKIVGPQFNAFADNPYGVDAVMIPKDSLNMKSVAIQPHIGGGYEHNKKKYTLYMMGLYNLMWLRLGIGRDNQPLTLEKDGDTYLAHRELEEMVNQSPANPWNDNFMRKEEFLEYQIAKLFNEDEALFQKARASADFLYHAVSFYDQLISGKVYDDKAQVYSKERIEAFIPGEKQIVAFYISLLVRQLWYIGVNPAAFSEVVLGDERIPFAGKMMSLFSGELMATWKEIVERLKTLDTQDFVSFSGHGYVVSFDQLLLEMQNAQNVYDKSLLENLGFAGIESWCGKQFKGHVFYSV